MSVSKNYPAPKVAWFSVGLLSLAYVSSFVDRMIMSLLVTPIKEDLAISDTQMGLLLGLSFTVFYTLLGLPIGWLADRKNRKNIIAIGVAAWSIMTAVCGLAGNYIQLFIARMGVGVGEAALTPPAYSIITDSFPKRKLATAISVYAMGIYIGSGLAYMIGGWVIGWVTKQKTVFLPFVGELFSWQLVFFYVGLPGILIAVLIYFLIREPSRKGLAATPTPHKAINPNAANFGHFFKKHHRFLLTHHFAYGFFIMMTYSVGLWIPSHLERNFGIKIMDIGLYYGLIICCFGPLGVVSGGRISDWLSARGDQVAKLKVGIFASLMILPFTGLLALASDANTIFLLLIPITFCSSFPLGAGSAALQEAVPNQMRAFSSAIYVLISNLVGLGLGPFLVGIITDQVFHDEKQVGSSLVIVAVTGLLITLCCLFFCLKPYKKLIQQR